jgi:GAF domain-containing protein
MPERQPLVDLGVDDDDNGPETAESLVDLRAVVADRERLGALRRLALLDTPTTEALDRLVRLVARVMSCPIALLTLVDADRQYFKAAFGLPEPVASLRQTPLSHSICQHVVARGARLVICDAAVEHWLDDNMAVKEFGVRAYAGVPLVTRDGYAVGTLCAVDVKPRFWTVDELDNLEDLAGATMREISMNRLERTLSHQRTWHGVSGPPHRL